MMETDYSHYAVQHEAQHGETEPSMALQLLSACWQWGPGSGTWGPGSGEGIGALGAGQGLGSPPLPRAITSSTPCPSPRGFILG